MEKTVQYDVFGMCNALFDLQAEADYGMLSDLALTPGGMHLLDAEQHAALVSHIGHKVVNRAAGGSGANTTIGIAALGGTACFTSRIGKDEFGPAYRSSLSDAGVTPILANGDGNTGLCVVLITPDKQRTMCTYLGESRNLAADNVDLTALSQSRILYVTGYLWDTESQMQAVETALDEARKCSIPVALSLSDTFCISRHRDDFLRLLDDRVSIVFANNDEACHLTDCPDAEEAARRLGAHGRVAFVTLGPHGAYVACDGNVDHVAAAPVDPVDTTGAGDAFAAGALYGLTHGLAHRDAAALGADLAASVVGHLGPRPPAQSVDGLRDRWHRV